MTITSVSVGGTLVVIFQCCGLDLLTNMKAKEYGPIKEGGEYVHTGDSVGVVMDTTKGELSFVVDGIDLGVAFDGIPLDKPLVPCVLLGCKGDSVELDMSFNFTPKASPKLTFIEKVKQVCHAPQFLFSAKF